MTDTQPFEELEAKIVAVLERLSNVQAERTELQKQVAMWQSRCDEMARKLEDVTRQRDELKGNQRDPEHEELIRRKITSLLAKLEAA